MVSLPTSSDEDNEIDYEVNPFEEEHKGFPESCFCGGAAILETKKSGPEAGRLYYRCSNSRDQDNTVHLGKWFDTAVEEECQKMRQDLQGLQCQSRVDFDYVSRLCALEASHERMKVTVAWLAEEVEGWMDNFKLHALLEADKFKSREWVRRCFQKAMSLLCNKVGMAVAVALVTSFISGWKIRDFM